MPVVSEPTVLAVLASERKQVPPVWMMRQAGRFLPEYRAVRAKVPNFLDLCFTPELAAEVTLQPIRRFGLDAAILFSDILVVPHALGQNVTFSAGEGPLLAPTMGAAEIARLSRKIDLGRLEPVFATIKEVRGSLAPEVALLGFCGAPWTVATYMVAGRGTPDQAPARLLAYRDEASFSTLIDILVEASSEYLVRQFEAGVDAVQVFDSWAGVLPSAEFRKWCFAPLNDIVAGVKARWPQTPIIAFPRGANQHLAEVARVSGADVVGLDTSVDLDFAADLQRLKPVQGNLDPLALLAGGAALDRGTDDILDRLGGGPLIFNLGHGVLPQTPLAHVQQLIRRVRRS